jgi:hypothetical protein
VRGVEDVLDFLRAACVPPRRPSPIRIPHLPGAALWSAGPNLYVGDHAHEPPAGQSQVCRQVRRIDHQIIAGQAQWEPCQASAPCGLARMGLTVV